MYVINNSQAYFFNQLSKIKPLDAETSTKDWSVMLEFQKLIQPNKVQS